jgi:SOS-response transcriptional repressor LexA
VAEPRDLELAAIIEALAGRGAAARMRVAGGSMHPALRGGDVVLIEPIGRCERGDVVVAKLEGRIVMHRVVSVAADHVRLRGDNRIECDPPIALAEVIGRVTRVERDGREMRVARAGVLTHLRRLARTLVKRRG